MIEVRCKRTGTVHIQCQDSEARVKVAQERYFISSVDTHIDILKRPINPIFVDVALDPESRCAEGL